MALFSVQVSVPALLLLLLLLFFCDSELPPRSLNLPQLSALAQWHHVHHLEERAPICSSMTSGLGRETALEAPLQGLHRHPVEAWGAAISQLWNVGLLGSEGLHLLGHLRRLQLWRQALLLLLLLLL
jgi:hypothetical protein